MDRKWLEPSYVINLSHRTDRLHRIQARFALMGLTFTRFDAVHFSTIEVAAVQRLIEAGVCRSERAARAKIGCTRSHRGVLEQARDRGLPWVVTFEDDVVFDPRFWARYDALQVLPNEWDFFNLGGRIVRKGLRVAEGVRCQYRAFSATGYIVKESAYDLLIGLFAQENGEADRLWFAAQDRPTSLIAYPALVSQAHGYSDVTGRQIYAPGLWRQMSFTPEEAI